MLKDLSKSELLKLINLYNDYVQEFFDDEVHEGMIPVCIEEFYNNEYQEFYNDNEDTDTNYYLRNKFFQEFNMERLADELMDLCNQEELNKFIVQKFRENIDLKEYRTIFDDLNDEDFIDFMEYLGFDYTIEEYNKLCGFEEEN